jgi:acid stress-induced BolA-like protein IbaG/YrbA
MQNNEIKALIVAGIPDARVTVSGDDGTHFEAVVVSGAFRGKTMVQQHKLVYQALGERMGKEIHALSIQTCTPEEWDRIKEMRVV